MDKNDFSKNSVYHIYHRTLDKGVIFYSEKDRIVYYTLAAVRSKNYHIKVAAASIMFTHIHQGVLSDCSKDISMYLNSCDSSFSRLYNNRHSRTGKLFCKKPGISEKNTSKGKRSVLIYIFNNHVEKGLCSHASEERWSLFAYANSNHPFSQEIDLKKASRRLIKSMKYVDRHVKNNTSLEYRDLDLCFSGLSVFEKEQLTDYIIDKYSLIDYSIAFSYFGSYGKLYLALEASSGSEYEITEDYYKEKDTGYINLIEYCVNNELIDSIFTMNSDEKYELAKKAYSHLSISIFQLWKFFHITSR